MAGNHYLDPGPAYAPRTAADDAADAAADGNAEFRKLAVRQAREVMALAEKLGRRVDPATVKWAQQRGISVEAAVAASIEEMVFECFDWFIDPNDAADEAESDAMWARADAAEQD